MKGKYNNCSDTHKIIGCFYNVHNKLGSGFLEKVYQEALALEFTKNKVPFKREKSLVIYYENQPLNCKYIADFICYNNIIIEVKAVTELVPSHYSQILNYLKATNSNLGLLVNFGSNRVEIKRVAL